MHRELQKYAVFGNPIGHSKSPMIHTLFAKQLGQDNFMYSAMSCEPDHFVETLREFLEKEGLGANITLPFKQQAFKLADRRTHRAQLAGAVNTVWIDGDQLVGDNTDGAGLVRDLSANLGWQIEGKRVLLLGAGGAVRGVLGPLLEQKPGLIFIANRTADKARELAQQFAEEGPVAGGGFDALAGQQFDLVINGTSASLAGELPPLPDGLMAAGGACYDMMYAAKPTIFLLWATGQGVERRADGLGMLVEQAAEAFALWRHARPETAPVIEVVRQRL